MARSLAKIKEQIARLQKEADSIQSTVIARMKREIAQHGLTSDHLFGSADSTVIGNGGIAAAKTTKTTKTQDAPKVSSAKKADSLKQAKYADDKGNAWHGVGKRPQWIHAALDAGRELTDFLVGANKTSSKATRPSAAVKTIPKAGRKTQRKVAIKVATVKKSPPAKNASKIAVAAKPAANTPAKKKSLRAAAKPGPAKKASRVKAADATSSANSTPTPS